jgi:hypothetical protein
LLKVTAWLANAVLINKGKSVAMMSSPGHSGGESPADGADPRPMSETPGAMQSGVLPLLGKPYFTCILCKSHVHQPFQVVLLLLMLLLHLLKHQSPLLLSLLLN